MANWGSAFCEFLGLVKVTSRLVWTQYLDVDLLRLQPNWVPKLCGSSQSAEPMRKEQSTKGRPLHLVHQPFGRQSLDFSSCNCRGDGAMSVEMVAACLPENWHSPNKRPQTAFLPFRCSIIFPSSQKVYVSPGMSHAWAMCVLGIVLRLGTK